MLLTLKCMHTEIKDHRVPQLSQCELDALVGLRAGTSAEAAEVQYVSPRTINFHLYNIYGKICAPDRTGKANAIISAFNLGILSPLGVIHGLSIVEQQRWMRDLNAYSELMAGTHKYAHLTPSEADILQKITQGDSTLEIATSRQSTSRSVYFHAKNLNEKLKMIGIAPDVINLEGKRSNEYVSRHKLAFLHIAWIQSKSDTFPVLTDI